MPQHRRSPVLREFGNARFPVAVDRETLPRSQKHLDEPHRLHGKSLFTVTEFANAFSV